LFRRSPPVPLPLRCARICALLAGLVLAAGASALEQVTLQLKWEHQFQFAGYYAAQEQGFYREAGLDVTLRELERDGDSVQSVLSGAAAYGVANTGLLVNRSRGEPVVVLASIFQHSPDVLLVRTGTDGQPDLKPGGTLMLAPSNVELLAFVKKSGPPLSTLRQVNHTFKIDDLIAGRVDAMAAYSTDVPFLLARQKVGVDLISPQSIGVDFYGDVLFTTETELREHPARAAAMRAATLRGWRYAMEHPRQIVDLIRARYPHRLSRELLLFEASQMVPLMETSVAETGYSNPQRWRAIAALYQEVGILPADFSIDGFLYQAPGLELRTLYISLTGALFLLLLAAAVAWRFMRLGALLQAERSALRATQEQLTNAENLWGFALEGSGEGMWQWTQPGGELTLSPRYKELLGYGPDEFQVRFNAWLLHVHPEDVVRLQSEVKRFSRPSADRGSLSCEFRMRCKDDSWKWVLGRAIVVARDAQGRPLRMTGTMADISDRKQAEEARVRAVLEASPEAMLVVDAEGRIRYANQLCAASFGYQLADLAGMQATLLAPVSKMAAGPIMWSPHGVRMASPFRPK